MAELHISWVEIPVKDIDRALKFYREVFQLPEIPLIDDGPRRTATIVHSKESGKAGVSLNQTANFEPGDKGPLAYFEVGAHLTLTAMLNRAETNGGKISAGMTDMGGGVNYAMFVDTEGNTVALSSYEALPNAGTT